eukprot:COSAG01_NODE_5125_length_4470_cov_2.390300_3_plen_353_part_00
MRAVAVSSLPVDGCHLTHAPGHMCVQPPLDCGFDDVDFSCVCRCSAMPGGPIEPSAYAQMKSWIVDGIAEAHAERPLDGVWLELHGAMYTAGMEDCEGDLTVAVREAVGGRALISASLDLHGNFSPRIASAIDMCTAFRTAPHIDEYHQLRCVCTHWGYSVILTAIPGIACGHREERWGACQCVAHGSDACMAAQVRDGAQGAGDAGALPAGWDPAGLGLCEGAAGYLWRDVGHVQRADAQLVPLLALITFVVVVVVVVILCASSPDWLGLADASGGGERERADSGSCGGGGRYSRELQHADRRPGVIDASVLIGYCWCTHHLRLCPRHEPASVCGCTRLTFTCGTHCFCMG